MSEQEPIQFDPASFLASTGLGRRIVQLKPKQAFFSQGDPADSIFYLQKGRAKLTVVSTKRQRSHDHASSLPATSLERSRIAGGGRAAHGHCHCHYRLHSAQDREARR